MHGVLKYVSRGIKILVLSSSLGLIPQVQAQEPPTSLTGSEFREWLRTTFYDQKHESLGYDEARVQMYGFIDNYSDTITCIYGGFQKSVPRGTRTTYPAPFNAEHTIPQSHFGEKEPMKSDLHHLFPTYQRWNSFRSSKPFAEIPDSTTRRWLKGRKSLSSEPERQKSEYSESTRAEFEPPEGHKGNTARAIFYFFTMYPNQNMMRVGNINTLFAWHLADPPDERERRRDERIKAAQGNENPFIDHPEWVSRAWPEISRTEVDRILSQLGLVPEQSNQPGGTSREERRQP